MLASRVRCDVPSHARGTRLWLKHGGGASGVVELERSAWAQ